MTGTTTRFSLRRLAADLGRILATRWASLLVVLICAGVAMAVVGEVQTRLYADFPPDGSLGSETPWSIGRRLVDVVLDALIVGAVLHVALKAGAPGEGPLGALKTPLKRFPALALPFLLTALPTLANVMLADIWLSNAFITPGVELQVAWLSAMSGVLSLMVFAFVGLAPAAAVAEDLGPGAALRRGLALAQGRSLLLFAVYGLGLAAMLTVPVGIALLAAQADPFAMQAWIAHWVAPPLGVLQGLGMAAVYLKMRRISEDPAGVAGVAPEAA